MPRIKITKRAIDALTAGAADAYYWDTDRDSPIGFGVRVTPKGVKSFVYQYRLKGQPARRVTIARYGSTTVEQARGVARQHAHAVASGLDPIEAHKKAARDNATLGFAEYVERFTDAYLKAEWPDAWADARARLINHAVPLLGRKALPAITSTDVGDVLDPLRAQRALARNLYVVLKLLFDWAAAPERRDIAQSPMVGMKAPIAPRARKRVLTPSEIVAAWKASYSLTATQGAFVRLLFATLQRRSEVANMVWTELREKDAIWLLPGDRAKNEEDHLVPLNALATLELEAIGWKRKGPVLTTTGLTGISGFSKLKRKLDAEMLKILQKMADDNADALGEDRETVALEPWRLHDIRRTGTTQMQALGVPVETNERIINHKAGEVSGLRKVYNLYAYEAEKRRALDQWGVKLEQMIAEADGPRVVPIAARS